MTFSNAFSWKIMYEFQLTFHWSLFLRVKLKHSSIGSDNGSALTRCLVIIWINDSLGWWCMYVSLSINELPQCALKDVAVISKCNLWTHIIDLSSWTLPLKMLEWMRHHTFDDKLRFVLVKAWCCQAKIHYLSQCWPSCSMSPLGITRPQWVEI